LKDEGKGKVMVPPEVEKLFREIVALPRDWHGAGTLSAGALLGILRYLENLDLAHTVETGCGKSTLLLSHLSRDHKVFSTDGGNSLTRVKESSLLARGRVEFIEGPTQQTLPGYRFDFKIQFALLDGPHGYPFPELEYWHLYPHLDVGAVLVVDDCRIPTVGNMVSFLIADDMFDVLEIIDGNTAFFRRTDAPTFDPFGDRWFAQGYNRSHYEKILRERGTP
jgi:hypothetical protein